MPENGGGVTKAYGLCVVAEDDESQLAKELKTLPPPSLKRREQSLFDRTPLFSLILLGMYLLPPF